MTVLRATLVVAWTCAAAVALAQPDPSVVLLDVVVDGEPASTLSAEDFAVTESGRAAAIRTLRRPLVSRPEQQRTADDVTPPARGRLIGVFADEYHLRDDQAFANARLALAALIREDLHPDDRVVIVKPLDSLVNLTFAVDHEAAATLVAGVVPRFGDYSSRSALEHDLLSGTRTRIDAARNQIAWSAINAVSAFLGSFPGERKTLIVFSNGIERVRAARGTGPLPGPESVVRTANLGRVAIYAVQPTPAATDVPVDRVAAPDSPPDHWLHRLADETSGLVLTDRPGRAGLQRVLSDAGRYYVLALEAPPDAVAGALYPVRVGIRGPGVRVRARTAVGIPRLAEDRVEAPAVPSGLTVPRHTSPLIRTWFGQSPGDQGGTAVEFVWEPERTVPGARGAPPPLPARVTMHVATMDGTPVFDGTVEPSGGGAGFGTNGQFRLAFTAPPGTLLVQMDVVDAAGRTLDRDVRDLRVTGFSESLAFGSAAVFRGRTRRDLQAIRDAGAAPVATRRFSRAEHIVVRLPVVSRQGAVTVTARVSRFGSVVRDLPAVVTTRGSLTTAQVDLPLAPLASGAYAIEWTARDGGTTIAERLDFVVTP